MKLCDLISTPSRPDLQLQLAAAPLPADLHRCLITGPPRSGKTSLLFHLAYSLAREGKRVVLLCSRGRLEAVPPLLPDGVTHHDPAWQRVGIKYLGDGGELLRFTASLHLLKELPEAVLLDDLHSLADLPPPHDHRPRPRDMGICRLLALLHDTADFLGQRLGAPCLLAVTELSSGDGPRLYLTQRWLPLVLTCKPIGHTVRLGVAAPVGTSCPAVDFSLRHATLTVEAVHPSSP